MTRDEFERLVERLVYCAADAGSPAGDSDWDDVRKCRAALLAAYAEVERERARLAEALRAIDQVSYSPVMVQRVLDEHRAALVTDDPGDPTP